MILFLISFIAGVLTVLAPCILPLLPVIVGGSLDGGQVNRKKTFTIVISLGISVILFTLLLKASTLFINIPEQTWKYISGGIIVLIGVATLFPKLWEGQILAKISGKANVLLGKGDSQKSFWGDVIVGAALGPVFSTCSPTYFIVLATVLPVNFILGLVYMLTYVIGLCLALFLVAFIGQKIMGKLNIAADPKGVFKKVLGVIFIIVGVMIVGGYDKKLQTFILDKGFFDITSIEQKLLQLNDKEEKQKVMRKAPEISTPDGFVNTEGVPVTLEQYRGKKVVLLDIWTYSCINCKRTIPYLNSWYEKYKDDGFVIIGLHTPEFAFEKVQKNVEKATEELGIKYPVVLDNDFSTWRELGNQYWPRKYLIDLDGNIIYDHIGEGDYEETEKEIQKALKVSKQITKETDNLATGRSPEIYFGSLRSNTKLNEVKLEGLWEETPEYAINKSEAKINYRYSGKSVYLVASSEEPAELEIYQGGFFVKKIIVKDDKLYTLIENAKGGEYDLEIRIPKAGLKIFTFTFG